MVSSNMDIWLYIWEALTSKTLHMEVRNTAIAIRRPPNTQLMVVTKEDD